RSENAYRAEVPQYLSLIHI
ncbi:hypothetical protein AZ005_002230, partial [Escherichia coli]